MNQFKNLKQVFIVSLLLTIQWNVTAQVATKKVEFVGAARSEMSGFSLTQDNVVDTVTPGKRSDGYALIDLGFKINPNSSTEILGMIRIKNAFGGFWGAGVTFDVRQLYVRGVIANAVRYQLGNIDYKLTPYTFYNHNPDQLIELNGIQKIKQDIVNYESFYTNNNTWRQQGAAMDFGLTFKKYVQEVKVNGFITRMNSAITTSLLERLYGGGNVIVTQSKYATIGLNYVSAFDVLGTATDSNAYRNNVSTLTFESTLYDKNWKVGIKGETGTSKIFKTQIDDNNLSDYFVDATLKIDHKKSNVSLALSYLNVGDDFRSIGAQSKRVDFNKLNTLYQNYTNEQIVRPISSFDVYQNSNLYNAGISDRIMAYNPVFNNATPYGRATFNRNGIITQLSYLDPKKRLEMRLEGQFLREIRGQGTTKLKDFTVLTAQIKWDVSKTFKFKMPLVVTSGFNQQQTERKSDLAFEQINLTSTQFNAGIDFEFIPQFHLLAGINSMQATGNEILPERKPNGEIYNFTPVSIAVNELIYSGGIRFNFSDKIYLAGLYDYSTINSNGLNPYHLNQLLIVYSMKF